jgi:hypothetical protein
LDVSVPHLRPDLFGAAGVLIEGLSLGDIGMHATEVAETAIAEARSLLGL